MARATREGRARFVFPTQRITKTQIKGGLTVDLKYVTSKQKFTVPYEGKTIFFEVDTVSLQSDYTNTSQDPISQLEGLRIDDTPRVWIVGWDTVVVVLPADSLEPLGSVKVRALFLPDSITYTSRSETS